MHGFTDTGRTVLFATHYLEEAESYADRVVLMRAGRVVADGSVAEVTSLVSGRSSAPPCRALPRQASPCCPV